jgi:hypothetical protein
MVDIEWETSTTIPLVTYKWICHNYKDANMNHIILDEGGQC